MARPILYPPTHPYLEIQGVSVEQWRALTALAEASTSPPNTMGITLDKLGVHYCGQDGLVHGFEHMRLAYHRVQKTLYIIQEPHPNAQPFLTAYGILKEAFISRALPPQLLGDW